jgi:C-terminus of AA_permease
LIICCGATHAGSSKLFTMQHLSHVHPLGSLVEQTQETGHELKRAVGPGGLTGIGVGIILCIYLSLGLPWQTYLRFVAWLAVGIVICLLYGYSHSRLRHNYPDASDVREIDPDADAPQPRTPSAAQ